MTNGSGLGFKTWLLVLKVGFLSEDAASERTGRRPVLHIVGDLYSTW
jgi:hypothetical protein